MRASEFLIENILDEANLSLPDIKKHPWRVDRFLEKILIGSPFLKKDQKTEFIADKSQYEELKELLTNPQTKANQIKIVGTNGETLSLGQLFKTPDLAFEKVAIGDIYAETKESFVIKPSDIFRDEKFRASAIFNEVINNQVLASTEIGRDVIKLAEDIKQGSTASWVSIKPEYKPAIRDYAGEYLGVLALVKGIADFPTADAFLDHMDTRSFNSISVYFPREKNAPLGDSIGYFKNAAGNQIYISSKGGSKGNAPSLVNLKIPGNLINSRKFAKEIKFLKIIQNPDKSVGTASLVVPFLLFNYILAVAPESMGKLARMSPFTREEIVLITTEWMDSKKYSRKNIVDMPRRFRTFLSKHDISLIKSQTATPGGIMHYLCLKDLKAAININNALPNWEPLAREILQQNFIQIFTKDSKKGLNFSVVWPNRQLATGRITFEFTSYADDPSRGLPGFYVK